MAVLRVPVSPLIPGALDLPPDTARYVSRVHRLGPGDHFVAFDPEAATEADAKLLTTSRDRVRVDLSAIRPATLLPKRRVTVIQGIAKGDKLDAVVRDATELGATSIAPAFTVRSIADHKSDAKVARLRRIAVEAARQCGRGDVPVVETPRALGEIVATTTADLRIVLVPGGQSGLGELLRNAAPDVSLALVIGPEGGLDASEIAECEAAGFVRGTLGGFVLRTETACAAALGAALAFEHPS